ncbi:piggyBac transposable element-derived protein 4 [Nephila pilipes]|uniref:PiggyBac transposable element-derived protein 4 n=1 Tax=Nephila pilipes TaxID=299642 RepID=A0A8X6IU34_NEPPI|nr:piggyBac transposable element-derived protein 4 [Nephila pilipes]
MFTIELASEETVSQTSEIEAVIEMSDSETDVDKNETDEREEIPMEVDEDTDDSQPPDNEAKKDNSPKEESEIVDVPVPPGYWRLGLPHPKTKAILLRFATKAPPRFLFTANLAVHLNSDIRDGTLQFLDIFFDDNLLEMIVAETNQYADRFIRNSNLQRNIRTRKRELKTKNEVQIFITLNILQGNVKRPDFEHFWSKRHSTSTPPFFFQKSCLLDAFILFIDIYISRMTPNLTLKHMRALSFINCGW